MENEANGGMINSFCEITSSSKEEALFFLESHKWDLDAAVSTYFDNNAALPVNPIRSPSRSQSPAQSPSESFSPSESPSRSRSLSPPPPARGPYELRSRRTSGKKQEKPSGSRPTRGGIRTLADLNKTARDDTESESDEPQEYYTGGEKSGMLVQDPTKANDVDAIFDRARQFGVERPTGLVQSPSSSRSFTGTARLLSGEAVPTAPSANPQQPEVVNHTITFWRNGFTLDDGPLRRLDDPENASFLESVIRSECPKELQPTDRRTPVNVELVRRDEDYKEVKKPRKLFQGVGRTLGSSTTTIPTTSEPTVADTSLSTAPSPQMGLVVDESSPTTSIQLRLADGTRMVSRFNYHHTIRDIHAFIDASRPGGSGNYRLQMMGFPPKPLTDLSQTIEQAGLANSVVIQKY